jgi:hypothetical protein
MLSGQTNTPKKTRMKINKAKATFTGRSPRHTKVGHPEGTKPSPWIPAIVYTFLGFFTYITS